MRDVLARDYARLVDMGQADAVLATAAELGDEDDERVLTAVAYARLMHGDWPGALPLFDRAAEQSAGGPLPPGLAWRMGLARYLRGELDAAEAIFDRGRTGDRDPAGDRDQDDIADEAILLSWVASARWGRGRYDEAARIVQHAEELARRSGDARAVAATQTVLTMVAAADGDRCRMDSHHRAALEAARRSGDVCAQLRVYTNRADHLTEQGRAREAVRELETALAIGDQYGYAVYRAIALNNQGEAYGCLGRYDAAVDSFLAAREAFQAMGSRNVAYPLAGLGRIHRARGEAARARAALTEAVEQAERVGNRQGLVSALAGLARVRAADDLDAAEALADRAVELGEGPRHAEALLARGWIALQRGDSRSAARDAAAAADVARSRRDEAALAESLELQACAGSRTQETDLADAAVLWQDLGNALGAARARLLAAHWSGDRSGTAAAATRLRGLGVRLPWAGIADGLALVAVGRGVRIQALGLFRVLRDGVAVPPTAWQSKKARDLLKILVARRGRPATREELIGLLWSDDDSANAANRLSVLLSTLHAVLDPAVLVTDRCTVRLDLEVVETDVESFAARAAQALDAWRRDAAGAAELLARAEASYTGDFCEEDVYEPWAEHLREELRALHLAVVRALTGAARADGEVDGAVRWLLAVLRHDPYDEPAHLGLIDVLHTAGRYGDARRHYRAYTERMAEIGVPAAPFPISATRAYVS